jgi:hypothetical protein
MVEDGNKSNEKIKWGTFIYSENLLLFVPMSIRLEQVYLVIRRKDNSKFSIIWVYTTIFTKIRKCIPRKIIFEFAQENLNSIMSYTEGDAIFDPTAQILLEIGKQRLLQYEQKLIKRNS